MNLLSQLKSKFNVGELWIPNHAVLQDELLKFKPVRDSQGRWKVQGVGAHDDCVISLAMAVDGYIKYGGQISLETLDNANLISFKDANFTEEEIQELFEEARLSQVNLALQPDYYR
jgi:hypothetical protein